MRRKFVSATLMSLTMVFAAVSLQSCGEKDDITTVLNEDGYVIDFRSVNNPDNVIGRGYDVTSYYAAMSEIKDPVLNYDELAANNLIQTVNEEKLQVEMFAGDAVAEIQGKISEKLGLSSALSVFSDQMKMAFDDKRYEIAGYSYAIQKELYIKKAMFVIESENALQRIESLIPYLTNAFVSDIANPNCTPADLIAKYGTHVMLGGIWGASMDYNYSSLSNTQQDIIARAEEHYDAAINLANAVEIAANSVASSPMKEKWIAIGGAVESGSTEKMTKADYDAWVSSISGANSSNDTWCDYYPGSLVPISEFIADENRKKAVEDAINGHSTLKKIGSHVDEVSSASSGQVSLLAEGAPFSKVGGAHRVSGEDDDVNSKSGRSTRYWIDITFSKRGNQSIHVEVTYAVAEQAKNYTKLETTASFDINVSMDIASISQSSYNISGVIIGENHGWIGIQESRFNNLQIRIDGTGNDLGNIGVRWEKIVVPYTSN